MIVVLSNKDDSKALLLEAQRQRLTDGDFVFFLLQHFEVSETVSPVCLHRPHCLSHCSGHWRQEEKKHREKFRYFRFTIELQPKVKIKQSLGSFFCK